MNSLSDKEGSDNEGLPKLGETVWSLSAQTPAVDGEPGTGGGAPGMLSFNPGSRGEAGGVFNAVGLGDLASLTVANESENGGMSHYLNICNFPCVYCLIVSVFCRC